jgi:hypothetical protein
MNWILISAFGAFTFVTAWMLIVFLFSQKENNSPKWNEVDLRTSAPASTESVTRLPPGSATTIQRNIPTENITPIEEVVSNMVREQ